MWQGIGLFTPRAQDNLLILFMWQLYSCIWSKWWRNESPYVRNEDSLMKDPERGMRGRYDYYSRLKETTYWKHNCSSQTNWEHEKAWFLIARQGMKMEQWSRGRISYYWNIKVRENAVGHIWTLCIFLCLMRIASINTLSIN